MDSRAARALDGRAGFATMATVNAVVERGCSMLVHFDRAASASEIKEALESRARTRRRRR